MIYAHATDIDECRLGRDYCIHDCRDTDGSYECGCPIGQKLAADNHNCEGKYSYIICALRIKGNKDFYARLAQGSRQWPYQSLRAKKN